MPAAHLGVDETELLPPAVTSGETGARQASSVTARRPGAYTYGGPALGEPVTVDPATDDSIVAVPEVRVVAAERRNAG